LPVRQELIPEESASRGGFCQKSFAKRTLLSQSHPMVQPVAIVLSDRVVIGAQLEQKLEALDYRVKVSDNPEGVESMALEHKPLVVLIDLAKDANLEAASVLSAKPETRHVPLVGYAHEIRPELQTRANNAGISIVVTDSAILQHLKPLLCRALQVE
jgi:CheY-like chemotaxis protein